MSNINPYLRRFHGHEIDVYTVAALWQVTDPAQFHALKKILGSGTGEKSHTREIEEARQALLRSLELEVDLQSGVIKE